MKKYSSLTEREKEILQYLSTGATNKDIGDYLCISENTVKTHIANILIKLDVKNRYQAALYVIQNNINGLYNSINELNQVITELIPSQESPIYLSYY